MKRSLAGDQDHRTVSALAEEPSSSASFEVDELVIESSSSNQSARARSAEAARSRGMTAPPTCDLPSAAGTAANLAFGLLVVGLRQRAYCPTGVDFGKLTFIETPVRLGGRMRIRVERRHSIAPRRGVRPIVMASGLLALMPIVIAPAADAATSGSNISTVTVLPPLLRSVTVTSPSHQFGGCVSTGLGSQSGLTVPGGECFLAGSDGVTISNGPLASEIDVNGGDAVPSDGGTDWALPASLSSYALGTDVYEEKVFPNTGGLGPVSLVDSPVCDTVFLGIQPGDACESASPGQSTIESLNLYAPSATTDIASTRTITTTWTVLP